MSCEGCLKRNYTLILEDMMLITARQRSLSDHLGEKWATG